MNSICPIWGTRAERYPTDRDGIQANSPRAGGGFFLSGTAETILKSCDDSFRSRLTTWLIDQRRLGVEFPEILSSNLESVRSSRPLPVHDRADRLLGLMRDLTPLIGKPFCFAKNRLDDSISGWIDDETFSMMKAWSESIEADEIWYLLEFLNNKNFTHCTFFSGGQQGQGPHAGKEDYSEYVITPDGYSHLAELETTRADSQQAFIAMWFDETMNDVYENGIAPGIRDSGYEPIRIDRKEHNNKIDDEIIAEIRRSRFVVADFTHGTEGMRGGVYYEAGFARGLGLEVVSTCRQDLLDNKEIHFDTRQYNHIGWKKEGVGELRRALANRISATIGDGPQKSIRKRVTHPQAQVALSIA